MPGGGNALNPPPGGPEGPTRVSPCDATSAPDDGFSTLVAIWRPCREDREDPQAGLGLFIRFTGTMVARSCPA